MAHLPGGSPFCQVDSEHPRHSALRQVCAVSCRAGDLLARHRLLVSCTHAVSSGRKPEDEGVEDNGLEENSGDGQVCITFSVDEERESYDGGVP